MHTCVYVALQTCMIRVRMLSSDVRTKTKVSFHALGHGYMQISVVTLKLYTLT